MERFFMNSENPPKFHRYHNPFTLFRRTPFQQAVVWLTECCFIIAIVWNFSPLIGGLLQAHKILLTFGLIYNFPFQFWGILLICTLLSKFFHPIPMITGWVTGELLLQWAYDKHISWVLIIYVGWSIGIQRIMPYRGGEYYQFKRIFHEMGLVLLQIIGFLPLLYLGLWLQHLPIYADLAEMEQIRNYYLIYFLQNNLVLLIGIPLLLWLIDRGLAGYFPLNPEEQLKLQTDEDQDLNQWIPQPGEYYHQFLAHHSLEEDNHTIIFMLGKVRIYLCTRCTAMILGVFFSFTGASMLFELGHDIVLPELAIGIVIIAPIVPLLDWGLQALNIRQATTPSRLITGFVLGICMEMIVHAMGYEIVAIIMVAVYSGIFLILFYLRQRIRFKRERKEFIEDIKSRSQSPANDAPLNDEK
jgi:uncharacterized membrane protein